ncbi:Lrp/AsnC family transcriptional regulator [Actinokineospora iranica]|uniref:DNA-binding transcriptional regulator, Lrp family n=1 Tax=Actinokineospora iranica TaxID=1271860 RepID=A0A1G6J0Z1_9PSEU|nr:Lrp/AsnC family transcriptional regulator [Actinokineospora iranica]SDC12381.1 DNA-binding transcriptional regulator, Lrp family [Actinokineospora iranica]
MDIVDRLLLARLQVDATTPYATLGEEVGLSGAAAHERVRKLRERGVIRRTTVDVDPGAVGKAVLAFVMIEANTWMGGPETNAALRALPWVEEAHIVAGGASVLVKVRAAGTAELQDALREIFDLDGVTGTQTIVVLETFFERPVAVDA